MTTMTIMRNASIGETALCETIYNMLGDIMPTDDQMDEIIGRIAYKVNAQLPGSLVWKPYISEVWREIGDEKYIEEDDLLELIGEAAERVTDEFVSELEKELQKPYLSLRAIAEKIDDDAVATVYIEHLDGTHEQGKYFPEDLRDEEDEILNAEVESISSIKDGNDIAVYIRCRERQTI